MGRAGGGCPEGAADCEACMQDVCVKVRHGCRRCRRQGVTPAPCGICKPCQALSMDGDMKGSER